MYSTLLAKESKGELMPYFVYILECSDGSLYTGIAKDVTKRLNEHNNSKKGAKYTKARRPLKLVHVEQLEDKGSALKREYAIKQFTRLQKLSLIK